MPRAVMAGAYAAALAAAVWAALEPGDAALSLLLVAGALIVAGAAWLELGPVSAKEIALVATLGGLAAAGRVLFAAIPGVQPVTVICVAAGAALGVRAGFAVGALAAFASNVFLGQGPWTPWQMLAWGGCGAAGALARAADPRGASRSRSLCCRARLRVQRPDGRLGVVQLLPAHLGRADRAARARLLVRLRPRGREPRARARGRAGAAADARPLRAPARAGGRVGVKAFAAGGRGSRARLAAGVPARAPGRRRRLRRARRVARRSG